MRTLLSALPVVVLLACGVAPEPAPVQQAAIVDASARFVGPGDFRDPDCMFAYIDEVDAIVAEYRQIYRDGRAQYLAWYRDARDNGASDEELAQIIEEANAARDWLLQALLSELAGLEDAVCPCDPATDPECEVDYCDLYPQDPNCWSCDPATGQACDPCELEPNSEECFCLQNPQECGQCPPDMSPEECACMLDPDQCQVDYCDLYPQDPNCWSCDPATGEACDPCDVDPNSEECFCQLEPQACGECPPGMSDQECACLLDPASCEPVCQDPNDPDCWTDLCLDEQGDWYPC